MVFVVASGAVEAAPLQGSSTPVGSWSYGIVKTVSVGPQRASDNWVYQGNATFGYTVSIFDNNTSATTFELTVFRTMGAAFSVQFCSPSCSSPVQWVNLSYRAWESTIASANFTTEGKVVESGSGPATAIALVNSSVWLHGNLTETSVEHLPTLGWKGNHDRYLSADVVARVSVGFSPSLGLFPVNLTAGSMWTSTSGFQANGVANAVYFFSAQTPARTTTIGPISLPVVVATQGNVTVDGAYPAGSSINLGGVAFPAITLTVIGPFSVREGIVFVPDTADLFGSSSSSLAGNASGATTVQQSSLDLRPFEGGHFGLGASSWSFLANSANPADGAPSAETPSGTSPSVATGNPVSTVTVQGEPQTAAQATSTQLCLTAGAGCPTTGGGTSSPRALFGAVVVIGAAAIIAVVAALAVVTRRRRVPPPAYPNAILYPPGAAGPARAPATPATPPAHEDDPLDHLW
jgi:hypothetical protein